MFNATKNKNTPTSLGSQTKYDCADVINQLFIDFNCKCYICGDKTNKDLRVEHFVPHNGDLKLKYSWSNLFLACDYCNGIKSDSYNIAGKEIINPISEKPEDLISHKISQFPIIDVSFDKKANSIKIDNTIDFLEKVYQGHKGSSSAQIKKREDLIKNLKKDVGEFLITLFNYLNTSGKSEKEFYKFRLIDHLSESSNFIEFKREFIKSNTTLLNQLINELRIIIK